MKEINLEEILVNNISDVLELEYPIMYEDVLKSMKEACKQTLELAAENAEYYYGEGLDVHINKQSILNTINQIK